MPLTDVVIRNAKPTSRAFKLYDSGGLYLEVSPSGGKWRRQNTASTAKKAEYPLAYTPKRR
jgi:hypothetical protein